jgi:hydrogenase nickel incorporation protein HypA/HybF
MHEASITESVLSLALDKAQEAGARKVTRINLVLGELSGVVSECVRMYFEALAQDTIANGAVLAVTAKPVVLKCRKCGREYTPPGDSWDCPGCKEAGAEIIAGRECYMESIEVE